MFSATLSFAKTGEPISERETGESIFKTEKTIKEEKKLNKITINKKAESSTGCFLIVAIQSSLGIPANWAHCIGLYQAGF